MSPGARPGGVASHPFFTEVQKFNQMRQLLEGRSCVTKHTLPQRLTNEPVCLVVTPTQGEGPPGETLTLAVGTGWHQEVLKLLRAVQGLVGEHVHGFGFSRFARRGEFPKASV